MTEEQQQRADEMVNRHIQELRQAFADEVITEEDHDYIGGVMAKSGVLLLSLSENGWALFQRFINESRAVHKEIAVNSASPHGMTGESYAERNT